MDYELSLAYEQWREAEAELSEALIRFQATVHLDLTADQMAHERALITAIAQTASKRFEALLAQNAVVTHNCRHNRAAS